MVQKVVCTETGSLGTMLWDRVASQTKTMSLESL